MRIERLIAGWFTAPAGIFRQGDDMDRTVRYPVPAYLIETATERILIDTGLNPDAIADPANHYRRPDISAVVTLEQQESIADQLDVDTLTKLVITHLHWDHVGGLHLVPASVPAVIQRREWQAGHDHAAVQRNNFLPLDYAGPSEDRDMIIIDCDHDLLGDGSIELLHTPGHTPGHQSVRIGDLVIGADVTHFDSGLDDQRFPIFAQSVAPAQPTGSISPRRSRTPHGDPYAWFPAELARCGDRAPAISCAVGMYKQQFVPVS